MNTVICEHGKLSPYSSKKGRCKPCVNTKAKIWRENNPLKNLRNIQKASWKHYGVKNFTPLDYDRMYQVQQGKCAICGCHQSCFKRRLSVDHDHKTGQARGLLCGHCNLRLELVEDENFMLSSYLYLNKVRPNCE